MKRDPGFVFRVCLVFGDTAAILLAFLIAFLLRTTLDTRPWFFETSLPEFLLPLLILLPFWWIILAFLNLYDTAIFTARSRWPEIFRLALASAIGIMTLITYSFLANIQLFPTRAIAVYSFIACFILLFFIRSLLRLIRFHFLLRTSGTLRAVVVGNHSNTETLISYFVGFPEAGYELAGVVAAKKYLPKNFTGATFASLKSAISSARPDVIFQTDESDTETIFDQALSHHLLYYFVPTETALASHMGRLELLGDVPVILVHASPLADPIARLIKRGSDLILGIFFGLIALIPMLILLIINKILEPSAPALYATYRLSRFGKKVKIYKFRSIKPEFSGLSPERAFKKLGRPELIKPYRKNGDCLEDDPRISKFGRFLRTTSLDELPQLINVIKGDIALVGPRALVPGELKQYSNRALLLSVKSGLTGLAQVSGRRDLSFAERRALDLYYIQNWSIWLDLTIIGRTIPAILFHKGAK